MSVLEREKEGGDGLWESTTARQRHVRRIELCLCIVLADIATERYPGPLRHELFNGDMGQ